MISDEELHKSKGFTNFTISDHEKREKLYPSGLMDPVSIELIRKIW